MKIFKKTTTVCLLAILALTVSCDKSEKVNLGSDQNKSDSGTELSAQAVESTKQLTPDEQKLKDLNDKISAGVKAQQEKLEDDLAGTLQLGLEEKIEEINETPEGKTRVFIRSANKNIGEEVAKKMDALLIQTLKDNPIKIEGNNKMMESLALEKKVRTQNAKDLAESIRTMKISTISNEEITKKLADLKEARLDALAASAALDKKEGQISEDTEVLIKDVSASEAAQKVLTTEEAKKEIKEVAENDSLSTGIDTRQVLINLQAKTAAKIEQARLKEINEKIQANLKANMKKIQDDLNK